MTFSNVLVLSSLVFCFKSRFTTVRGKQNTLYDKVIFVSIWSIPDNSLKRHSWDVEVNLTERFAATEHQLSAVAAERDTLNSNLTRQSRELERLRAATRQSECGCNHSSYLQRHASFLPAHENSVTFSFIAQKQNL